jgi:hypothetical protein
VCFEAGEPLADVGYEPRLALLAVIDDIDTQLCLPPHHVRNGLADAGVEGRRIVRLATGARREHVEEVRRTRQAANMSGEDPLCTHLHAVSSYAAVRGKK